LGRVHLEDPRPHRRESSFVERISSRTSRKTFAWFSRNEVAFGSRAQPIPITSNLAKSGLSRSKATSIVPSCHQLEFGSPPSLRSRRFVPLNGFISNIADSEQTEQQTPKKSSLVTLNLWHVSYAP
jgi:hypothetical protein